MAGRIARRSEGLPGFWAVLFVRAAVEDPAGCDPLLAHDAEAAVAFRQSNALGTRNVIAFVAAWPTAHTLVCLRIAAPVTGHAARLTTGLGGLTPDRAPGSQIHGHPLDDIQDLMRSSHSSILPDQPAWSLLDHLSAGRTVTMPPAACGTAPSDRAALARSTPWIPPRARSTAGTRLGAISRPV